MQQLSIINLTHYQNKLNLVYCIRPPASGSSELRGEGCSVFRDDILFYIHTADAFFMSKKKKKNQGGFLTFNFKSVYSAVVLRADKIS